jgi:glucose-1-phosphate adenylyltransferase
MATTSPRTRGTNSTLAVILAGGRGERLKYLTDRQAKPALPFGGKYRVIDFPLSNCINSGIRKVGVATQYCAYDLIDHVQRAWGFLHRGLDEFIELWPAQQQTADSGWYAGTADAVYRNIDLIRRHRPQHVLVLAGDHIYKQDYGALIAEHIERGAEATVSCVEVPREEARRFGVIDVNEGDEIVSFLEKPSTPPGLPDNPSRSLVSMGIYVFDTEVLLAALRADAKQPESSHDFGRDILPGLVGRCRLFAHRFHRSCVMPAGANEPYWRDVGTLDAYWDASMDLVRPRPALDLYDPEWPLWTAQIQRPPARLVFDSNERAANITNAIIAEGCTVNGGTVRNAQLFHDVHLDSFSLVEDTVVLPGCSIGARARVRRAVLAPGCVVPEGAVIGEDAVSDARHFHCTPSGIVVVTPRMLARLAAADRAALNKTIRPAVRIAAGSDALHAGM